MEILQDFQDYKAPRMYPVSYTHLYLSFDVTEETLTQAVGGLKACGIKGFNLTMPNKNKIVELLDELSPTAQLIGAVNTVRNDNGKLKGFNTDGYGFTQSARDLSLIHI